MIVVQISVNWIQPLIVYAHNFAADKRNSATSLRFVSGDEIGGGECNRKGRMNE
ncbi:hypothetical protein [uncultured Odoribacter sp.]|uniref:hypothetical protein n=1 Tax=uncultured Odoribacter sp. TaxID=876416 RepID=UPI002606B054|nr:hypothetical protein [uncultured Odoribacter sp.]